MDARRRQLRGAFQSGGLTPLSRVSDLKYIGDYLSRRLRRLFGNPLTLSALARRTRSLSTSTLRSRIDAALQNERGNQCVPGSRVVSYHVPEVNRGGWITLVALFKTFDRGDDGYNLAPRGYRADLSRFVDVGRSASAKRCGCHSTRIACHQSASGCVWADRLCQPQSNGARGYPGVGNRAGQKLSTRSRRDANARLGRAARRPSRRSRDPSTRRDRARSYGSRRYARRSDRVYWRRPGPVVRYPIG